MGKGQQVKDKIVETTIQLIKKSNGKVENITIRDIAQKAGIGTGLINYHFGSKDKLLEECIQRIIGDVISVFRPQVSPDLKGADRIKAVAKLVMDFLEANPEISKISILGDMAAPGIVDNTMKTVKGFLAALNSEEKTDRQLTFCFTLILQGMFLRKDTSRDSIGVDISNKVERDAFIDFIVDRMYREAI